MIINDIMFNVDLETILLELQSQLAMNGIDMGKIRNAPKDMMVCCPYHGEHRPSAGIRKSDGQFHCFVCQENHSLQEVISFYFGHTDDILGKFGWNWLLKNFATMQVEDRKPIELNITRGQKAIAEQTYVSEEELDSYRYYHPYWAKRGITDEKIIELFDLGYCHNTDCIIMPIRNVEGRCLFVARRSVRTKFFQYPEGVTKPLYGLYELHQQKDFPKEVYVTESMIDALRLWQNGKYAVALNGLGNDLQFQQLRDLPCRRLMLATDNDKAGQSARERIKQNVTNKIITEVKIPDGCKDIGDCSDGQIQNLEEYF